MVRIINTVTLFLTTCKIITTYAPQLKLPFDYETFFMIAKKKVISQVELISHSDKLAMFFKSMQVMINTHTLKSGRDYTIDEPQKLTIKLPGNEKQEHVLPTGTKVLFLRVGIIYTLYAKSSFNTENASQTTIEQNLRSSPAYIGAINARRFRWREVNEVPVGEVTKREADDMTPVNMTMTRVMEDKSEMGSCIALDYKSFVSLYDIDLERSEEKSDVAEDLPF